MMKEILDILGEYHKTDFTERKAAMATVVKVEGSSYRQPGARMLITDDGKLTGAISGGCLEGDALRKALMVIARGKPMLVTYDTTDDHDDVLGIGLGCNGIIHILIEPIDPDNPHNPVRLLESLTRERKSAVLITLFSIDEPHMHQVGTCIGFFGESNMKGSLPGGIPREPLAALAREAYSANGPVLKNISLLGKEFSAFADLIHPAVSLVIAGAGNDVMPLVKMAGALAWHITLLDGRPSYATCQRFPGVQDILVTDAAQALSQLTLDKQTVFVLMTHNYKYDLALLQQLIKEDVPYIGVLGPKKKLARMLGELENEGIADRDRKPDSVYGPVGLDIGAETAEEIAVSVIAEILAVLSSKPGKSLRDKPDRIHSHGAGLPEMKEQVDYQQ
jgi:xanthine dehydrogenase accessory factor